MLCRPWKRMEDIGRFPHLCLGFAGNGGWSSATTPCRTSLSSTLGSASVCTGHSGWIAASAALVFPVGAAPWPFSGIAPESTGLWLPSLSFLPPASLPTLTCSPADVSVCESLRCVCVLSREFFVKLLLWLQGGRPGGLLMLPCCWCHSQLSASFIWFLKCITFTKWR